MQFPSYTQSHCYAPVSPCLHVNEICPLSRTKHLSGRGPWIWANVIFTSKGARGISWDSPGRARLSAGTSVLSTAECAPESMACWSKFLPRMGEVPALFKSPEEQQVIKSPSEKREREISDFHIKKSKKISQNYLGFKQGLGRGSWGKAFWTPVWCDVAWYGVCVCWANKTFMSKQNLPLLCTPVERNIQDHPQKEKQCFKWCLPILPRIQIYRKAEVGVNLQLSMRFFWNNYPMNVAKMDNLC